jgi:IPT/TIG domain
MTIARQRAIAPFVLALAAACGDSSRGLTGAGSITIVAFNVDTLRSGARVVITGSGFAAVASQNAVTVDGVAASVIAAQATSLTVTVPSSLRCGPPRVATVSVRAPGGTASHPAALRTAISRALDVGGSLVIADPTEMACNELPGQGARYVVTVFSDNVTTAATDAFTVGGTSGAATANGATMTFATPAPRSQGASASMPARVGNTDRADHFARLTESLRFVDGNRAAFAARVAQRRSARVTDRVPAPPPSVGVVRALNVPTNGCTGTRIGARVVYVSRRAILYEDTAWAFRGQMDTMYKRLGDIFDSQLYPTDSAAFADPLLTDSLTDNDGRIGMVFSPLVPNASLGFTSPCDLVPPGGSNTTSNFGEYFYGQLPTGSGGTLTAGYTPLVWLLSLQGTTVHETKHLASFEWRLLHNAPSEELWLEETLARHAEEQWARPFVYHVAWKGNTGYSASVYCDQHNVTDPKCSGQPEAMWSAFNLMYNFLDSTATFSPFGPSATFDFTFYSSGWSLVRWALDRYATDEQATLRALTQSQSLTGMANISARFGHSVDEILGNWSLAMLIDDSPAFAGNHDVDFPTWQLYDILLGLHGDFPTFYKEPVPPVVQRVSGDFSMVSNGVRGGGFLPLVITTSAAPTIALSVGGATSGGAAPGALRVAIARLFTNPPQ